MIVSESTLMNTQPSRFQEYTRPCFQETSSGLIEESRDVTHGGERNPPAEYQFRNVPRHPYLRRLEFKHAAEATIQLACCWTPVSTPIGTAIEQSRRILKAQGVAPNNSQATLESVSRDFQYFDRVRQIYLAVTIRSSNNSPNIHAADFSVTMNRFRYPS